jgi:hypothetical protein
MTTLNRSLDPFFHSWLFLLIGLICSLKSGHAVVPPYPVYRINLQGNFTIGNGLSAGRPGDGIFYAITSEGTLYTLRERNGAQVNVYRRPTEADSSTTLDWDVSNGYRTGVYAINGRRVVIVNAEGNYVDEFIVAGTIQGQPVVHQGMVCVSHFNAGQGFVTMFSVGLGSIASQLSHTSQIGPLGKDITTNSVYYGSVDGIIWRLALENLQRTRVVSGLQERLPGKPYADNVTLMLQYQNGMVYWWHGAPFEGQPEYNFPIGGIGGNRKFLKSFVTSHGHRVILSHIFHIISAVGSQIAPVLSRDKEDFYVVAGLFAFVLSNDDSKRGTIRHILPASTETKSKPLVDGGDDIVYNVEASDGKIYKYNATSGMIFVGFPYVCQGQRCGRTSASGHALLFDDRVLLVAYDDGTVTAICVDCEQQTPAPTRAPVPVTPVPTTRLPATPMPATPDTPAPTGSCGTIGFECTRNADCCSRACRPLPGTTIGECISAATASKNQQKLGSGRGGAGGQSKR